MGLYWGLEGSKLEPFLKQVLLGFNCIWLGFYFFRRGFNRIPGGYEFVFARFGVEAVEPLKHLYLGQLVLLCDWILACLSVGSPLGIVLVLYILFLFVILQFPL